VKDETKIGIDDIVGVENKVLDIIKDKNKDQNVDYGK
jgi:hypothetical protein